MRREEWKWDGFVQRKPNEIMQDMKSKSTRTYTNHYTFKVTHAIHAPEKYLRESMRQPGLSKRNSYWVEQ